MGTSQWSADAQQAFDLRGTTRSAQTQQQVFASNRLDPKMDPRVKKMRESRDSPEHPKSTAIAVFFDQTGSMGQIPELFARKKLGGLMRLLVERGFISDPQVLFGAIGDASSHEQAPIQAGEFESGIEMDTCLTALFLEGNGGGQAHESYELALYWAAHRASMDCLEKRGKRGYLFLIGDEMPYDVVRRDLVAQYLGDTIEVDIPLEAVLATVREKFEVFFVHVDSTSYPAGHNEQTLARWRALLGERCLHLEDPDGICELIGTTIGLCEGRQLSDISTALAAIGANAGTVDAVTKAVVPFQAATAALAKPGDVVGALARPGTSGGTTTRI